MLYNPSAACGAKTITIANKATASLYYYTPYQPNAAALAAGWGIGDCCSAYGNRNFFLYFTTWFGSTHDTVTGAIRTYWTAHKSAYGEPDRRTRSPSPQRRRHLPDLPEGHGLHLRRRHLRRGRRGADEVHRAGRTGRRARLAAEGRDRTGRTAAPSRLPEGHDLLSSAGTAAVARADLREVRLERATRSARLGWPTADAVTGSGGTVQSFKGGRIASAGSKTTVVTGSVLSMWIRRGAQSGTLGWPTADAKTVTSGGKKGTVQTFATGVVTVQGTARSVTGPLGRELHVPRRSDRRPRAGRRVLAEADGRRRRLGAGFSAAASTGARPRACTPSPTARCSPSTTQRGGTTGSLGWLVVSANDHAGIGGNYARFQNGRIYTSKVGTYAVLGAILEKWTAKDGTKGVLGWPTSNAKSASGGRTIQTFQHGKITWTAAGGAKASRS